MVFPRESEPSFRAQPPVTRGAISQQVSANQTSRTVAIVNPRANMAADFGGSVADDEYNQLVVLDVDQPRERYVCCTVDRGTQNVLVGGISALLYKADTQPVTHASAM